MKQETINLIKSMTEQGFLVIVDPEKLKGEVNFRIFAERKLFEVIGCGGIGRRSSAFGGTEFKIKQYNPANVGVCLITVCRFESCHPNNSAKGWVYLHNFLNFGM